MSEPIVERLFYLSEWEDEAVIHTPTLEGAASFLQLGKASPDCLVEGDGEWPGPGPLAREGETVELSVIELFANRVSERRRFDDGLPPLWALVPTPPPEADFFVPRYGERGGWDADQIFSSPGDLNTADMCPLDEDDDGVWIACGRQTSAKAVFRIVDGRGVLELVGA